MEKVNPLATYIFVLSPTESVGQLTFPVYNLTVVKWHLCLLSELIFGQFVNCDKETFSKKQKVKPQVDK